EISVAFPSWRPPIFFFSACSSGMLPMMSITANKVKVTVSSWSKSKLNFMLREFLVIRAWLMLLALFRLVVQQDLIVETGRGGKDAHNAAIIKREHLEAFDQRRPGDPAEDAPEYAAMRDNGLGTAGIRTRDGVKTLRYPGMKIQI